MATSEHNVNEENFPVSFFAKKSGPKAAFLNTALSLTLADSSLL